jgi:polyisoprenoid-binding protein YceI
VTTESTETPDPPTTDRRKRILLWGGIGLVVVIVLAGVFLWWFFKDDAPPAVDIDAAASQVTDADADTDADAATADTAADTAVDATEVAEATVPPTDSAAAPTDGVIDGTWSVDTSIGEFSFEESTGTFVGFRVEEELSAIGSTTAVGRTPAVSGTIEIEGTTVTDVQIEADMTEITTNDTRRNSKVQGALDTDEFPTATFRTTEPIELGEAALAGEQVSVSASGDLTIHGVTTPVSIPLDAQLVNDTIVVVGSIDIAFGDYGVEVPSAPIVLSAADRGPLELQLFLTR